VTTNRPWPVADLRLEERLREGKDQCLTDQAKRATLGPPMTTSKKPRKLVSVKNPHAVALGHLGGLKGGPARAEALSPKRRTEIARLAALARWGRVG